MARWYIIHAYSGFENKVKEAILSEAERKGLEALVEAVEVPHETVTEVKRGKKIQVERKTMPGYVLAKLTMNDDVYHLVKNTAKVTGFLGPNGKPQPISDREAARYFGARDAAAAGVDGVLVVDYPPEECEAFAAALKAHGLDLIFLLAPTSTAERMDQVARVASGYVYYVSLKGVTGAGTLDTAAVEAMLPKIRQHVKIPVGVGFGIRDAASARAVGRVADAVVIGSRIIQLIDNQPRERVVQAASDFLREIRAALDS